MRGDRCVTLVIESGLSVGVVKAAGREVPLDQHIMVSESDAIALMSDPRVAQNTRLISVCQKV